MGKGLALSSPSTPHHSENTMKVWGKSDEKHSKTRFRFAGNPLGATTMKAPDSLGSFFLFLETDGVFYPSMFGKSPAGEWRRASEGDFGLLTPADMIPTKMLVYRGPDGGTHSQAISNTRRRKKSTGELFQKGYRVRMGHGQVGEKEDQDSIWYSLGACFHVISYWGKTCRTRGRGGESPTKAERWRRQLEQVQVQDLLCIMLPIWQTQPRDEKRALAEARHGARHLRIDLFI